MSALCNGKQISWPILTYKLYMANETMGKFIRQMDSYSIATIAMHLSLKLNSFSFPCFSVIFCMTADDYVCGRKWNWEKNRRKPLPTFGRDLSKSGRDLTILILIAKYIQYLISFFLMTRVILIISLLASLVLIYFISSWNITEKFQKIILQYGGRARGMFSWSLIYNINIKTWTA